LAFDSTVGRMLEFDTCPKRKTFLFSALMFSLNDPMSDSSIRPTHGFSTMCAKH
jgi:hypothetical protein